MEETLLVGLAAVIVLGVSAQWLAWRVKLPSILLLLIVGFIAGPVTGAIDPDEFLGDLLFPIVSLSVAVILFEGGLTLRIAELKEVGSVVLRLVTIGVLITWGLAGLFAYYLANLSFELSLLFGALLTVTGPTVVGPLLRHVRPRGRVGPAAKWEGIVVDPIGAILAVLVFHAILLGEPLDSSTGTVVLGLGRTFLIGGVIGLVGMLLLTLIFSRHWVPDFLESPLSLGLVLGLFVLAQMIEHESGLVAVTLMGFLLANQKSTTVQHIVEFKENLRVLLISSLFILLSARLTIDDLLHASVGHYAFVVALILVVRPAAVFLSLIGSGLETREKLFLAWMAPRGIVAAAVASLFALQLANEPNMEQAEVLSPLTFLVIMGTVTVYGLTAGPLARKLDLAEADPQGVLIAGASKFACALARELQEAGLAVVLMDTNHHRVSQARLAGLTAVYGSALAEDAEEHVPLGGIGRILALTPNDEVNTLACLHFSELFGRKEVYQLVPTVEGKRDAVSSTLRGRELFGRDVNFGDLENRMLAGGDLRTTTLTKEFDYSAFRARNADSALPLLRISPEGGVRIATAAGELNPSSGDQLVFLADAEEGST